MATPLSLSRLLSEPLQLLPWQYLPLQQRQSKLGKWVTTATIFSVALGLSACGNQTQSTTITNADGSTTTIETKNVELLNVSFDISRDFYKEYNPLFIKHYQSLYPEQNLKISQSHGSSSKQAMSVASGLQADVVTMNQGSDIKKLHDKGLVADNWAAAFQNHAVPFTSTTVFLVRKGNPKHIKDWDDLTQQGLQIIIANPKTSGSGRYSFLGAYGYGLHAFNQDEAKTQQYMKQLLANVRVYESGGRSATTTFLQRQMGDVLVTFENEAHLTASKFGKGEVEIVYPSYTIESENPVAVIQPVVKKKGTTQAANEYLSYLWSKPAQQLAAELYFRPSDKSVLESNRDKLPAIDTFRAEEVFGNWNTIMDTFFKEGAIFDQLAVNVPE